MLAFSAGTTCHAGLSRLTSHLSSHTIRVSVRTSQSHQREFEITGQPMSLIDHQWLSSGLVLCLIFFNDFPDTLIMAIKHLP